MLTPVALVVPHRRVVLPPRVIVVLSAVNESIETLRDGSGGLPPPRSVEGSIGLRNPTMLVMVGMMDWSLRANRIRFCPERHPRSEAMDVMSWPLPAS